MTFRMIIALTCAVLLAGCNESAQQSSSASTTTTQATTTPAAGDAATPATGGKVHKLASGLQYEDMVVGSGTMAVPGMNGERPARDGAGALVVDPQVQLAGGLLPGSDRRLYSEASSREMWQPVMPIPVTPLPDPLSIDAAVDWICGVD